MRDDIRLVGRKGRHIEPRYVEYIRRLRPVLFYDFCGQPTKYDVGARDLVYDLSVNGNHGIINRVFGASVINEKFTSAFDTPVQLEHRYIYTTPAPVVTNPTGDITYTEGTDYTINYTAGQITVLSGGTIPDATACYIDYTYDDTGTSWRYACLDFDGVDDKVSVPNTSAAVYSEMCVFVWINPHDQITASYGLHNDIIRKNWAWSISSNSSDSFKLRSIIGRTPDNAADVWKLWSLTMVPYKWNFVGLTLRYNENDNLVTASIYVNGITETTTATAILGATTYPVFIGAGAAGTYKGTYGAVMIFDYIPTAHEINTIYELSRWRYMD